MRNVFISIGNISSFNLHLAPPHKISSDPSPFSAKHTFWSFPPLKVGHIFRFNTRNTVNLFLLEETPEIKHTPYWKFHLAFYEYTCLAEEGVRRRCEEVEKGFHW